MWLDFVHARAEIKTQCTVYVVISYVRHAAIYNLSQQTSPKVQKSFIFCSQGILPSIVHIPKTHLVFLYQQHYSHPHCPVFMRTLWHKVIHIYITQTTVSPHLQLHAHCLYTLLCNTSVHRTVQTNAARIQYRACCECDQVWICQVCGPFSLGPAHFGDVKMFCQGIQVSVEFLHTHTPHTQCY